MIFIKTKSFLTIFFFYILLDISFCHYYFSINNPNQLKHTNHYLKGILYFPQNIVTIENNIKIVNNITGQEIPVKVDSTKYWTDNTIFSAEVTFLADLNTDFNQNNYIIYYGEEINRTKELINIKKYPFLFFKQPLFISDNNKNKSKINNKNKYNFYYYFILISLIIIILQIYRNNKLCK